MSFWNKAGIIIKSVGKEAGTIAGGTAGLTYELGENIVKATKNGERIFKKIKRSEANDIVELVAPYRMRGGVQLGLTVAVGAPVLANSTFKVINRQDRGKIVGIEAQKGVSYVRESKPSENLDVKGINNYGATGDIVFALHNIRR